MFIPLGFIIVVALLWVAYRYRWNKHLNREAERTIKRLNKKD